MDTLSKPYFSAAGVGTALAAVAVWATNAVAAQVALARNDLGPVLVVMTGSAVLALLAVRRLRSRGGPPASRRDAVRGAAVGVVGLGGTLLLQYAGFAAGPLLETNVISYGWPMFAAVAMAVVLRTRRALLGVAFALVGFLGVLVLFSGSGGGPGHGPWGYLAALGSALCMAGYTLAARRLRLPLPDVLLAGAGAALVAALAWCAVAGVDRPPDVTLLAAAYCGVGPVAAGYLLWSRAMVASGGRLAPLGYAIPLLSTGLLVATGEPVTVRTAVGAVLIVACTAGVLLTGGQRPPPHTPSWHRTHRRRCVP